MDYRHILVATEFHKESLPVVTRGVEFAEKFNAQLSVVSVVPNLPYYMGSAAVNDIEKQLEAETKAKLDAIKQRFTMPMDCYLARGIPKVEIVRLAGLLGVDLIVIGTHGRHGVQMLLGSTASGVANRANCDVILVREH